MSCGNLYPSSFAVLDKGMAAGTHRGHSAVCQKKVALSFDYQPDETSTEHIIRGFEGDVRWPHDACLGDHAFDVREHVSERALSRPEPRFSYPACIDTRKTR
jgi:hypothetical protein